VSAAYLAQLLFPDEAEPLQEALKTALTKAGLE